MILAIATGVMLRMTGLGRSLYAIGLNQEAAFHAGIRVKRIKMSLFVLSGLVCAAVGILYAFELASAAENIGIGFELQVVTIVLLGGVSIFGGRGTILGVALAAAVYALLRSALLLTSSFNENDFQVVSGGLLILSVLVPNLAAVRAPRPGAHGPPARSWRAPRRPPRLGQPRQDRCAVAESLRLAAVDLGAESGRVVLGRFDGDTVSLDVCHRFANRPLWLPDGLHWNLPGLFAQTLHGLGAAADGGPLDGIGIDAWGCDYALLDADRRLLGLPFSYRDERTSAQNMERAHARVGRDELYARTGIQTIPINTIYQLASRGRQRGRRGRRAHRARPRPARPVAHRDAGQRADDRLHHRPARGPRPALGRRPRATGWDCRRPRSPARWWIPGIELGAVLERHAGEAGAAVGAPVRAVGGHDTASAFAAAPVTGARRRGPVLGNVVAAGRRAARARARSRRRRLQPHQRAGRV